MLPLVEEMWGETGVEVGETGVEVGETGVEVELRHHSGSW